MNKNTAAANIDLDAVREVIGAIDISDEQAYINAIQQGGVYPKRVAVEKDGSIGIYLENILSPGDATGIEDQFTAETTREEVLESLESLLELWIPESEEYGSDDPYFIRYRLEDAGIAGASEIPIRVYTENDSFLLKESLLEALEKSKEEADEDDEDEDN